MSRVITSLSLLLSISIVCDAQGASNVQANCITPDYKEGACVETKYCISIMTAIINNDHLTNPAVAKFLRESQCGIRINSQKVCCIMSSIDFGDDPITQDIPTLPPQRQSTRTDEQQQRVFENCGKLSRVGEEPFKWIGELWFKHDRLGRHLFESKCLGIAITNKHVIAPAHCVANLPSNVSLSHIDINDVEYAPLKIFLHAGYNQPKFANDIAIIELDTELNGGADNGANTQINNAAAAASAVVCLDVSQTNALKSTIAILKNEELPLRYGRISFIDDNQCNDILQQQFTALTSGQFCANIQSNGTVYSSFIGAVILQFDNTKKQYSLKGFTSTAVRTEQAFDESKPYIFTDVERQLSWIKSIVDSGGSSKNDEYSNNFDGLKSCQLSNDDNGRCVIQEHCTIFSDAPRPLSRQQEAYLDRIKCSTNANHIDENGICCPEKYVNQTSYDFDIDARFRGRRGAELLNDVQCGKVDSSRRIVGGRTADLKEFPWQAVMKYKIGRIFKYNCGGSLISSRYTLTCAHCIIDLPHGYTVSAVRLGEYDLTTDPDCRVINDDTGEKECNPPVIDYEIERLIPHSQYNNPRYSNDIGLVRMARDVEINRNGIVPICLPINDEKFQFLSDKYTVAGFGYTEFNRDSDVLLKIIVPKVARETCQSFHRSVIQLNEGQTCYGGEGIIDSCKGDSGNPLINYAVVDGKLKAIQMGIVTSGHAECGRGASGFPGIYTDVKHYMNWIFDNIEE